jgi:hypothetical protein
MTDPSLDSARRRYLLTVGTVGATVLAGCAGGDDNTTADSNTAQTDNKDTDTSTPTDQESGRSSTIPGVDSVSVGGGNVTVRRADDAELFGAELYNPDDELTGEARFNSVEREIDVPVGQTVGEYTLVVYEDGEEAGRRTLTLTRSFEITDGVIDDAEGVLMFRVRNTGDVIFSPEQIELLQSMGAEGFEHKHTVTDSLSGVHRPGTTRAYGVGGSLDFVKTDSESSGSACDWRLDMQYEITVTGGTSTTAHVTVEFGGEYRKETLGGEETYMCQSAEVVEFEGGSSKSD